MERKAVWLYGDGPVTPEAPVLFFEEAGVICDFSECGFHIATKMAVFGGLDPVYAPLKDVVRQLEKIYPPEHTEVRASNNGIAVRLRSMGVKTLKDLIKTLR